MINKVILIGNLGKDPEVKHLEGGSSVGRFSIATNESYKDKSGEWQTITEWHNVVVWRNLAERAERQLKKGNMVYVEGKLSTRKWQDQNGIDKYTTEVVANTFRLLERREPSGAPSIPMPGEQDHITASASSNVVNEPSPVSKPISNNNGPSDIEDDLPF